MTSDINKNTIQNTRSDFPILQHTIKGHSLVYFDNAATTQKPTQVIQAVSQIYTESNGSLNRSSHTLAREAQHVYEQAQETILQFVHASVDYSVTFTKNTTESLNLVAFSFFYKDILNLTKAERSNSIILISGQEHHSNLLPWMRLQNDFGFSLMSIPLDTDGHIDLNAYDEILEKHSNRIKIVSICHASNVIGHVNNIQDVARKAHDLNIPVVVDAAQTFGHIPINITELDADALVASSHKMYGPAGVGILILKNEFSDRLSPFLLGGGMIEQVTETSFTPLSSIEKFLAGTPNLEGIAGTKAAIEYLCAIGMDTIHTHEQLLAGYFVAQANNIPELKIIGIPNSITRLGLFAFTCPVHPHDVADYLDEHGIAIRAGFHCAQHLHQRLGIAATSRVSFGLYNTTDEIDYFFDVLKTLLNKFV